MIKGVMLHMALKAYPHDPCLLYGILDNPSSPHAIAEAQSPFHAGLYVDNFKFYSSDTTQEDLFQTLLQEHIQVDFMGDVDYFVWNVFTWIQHKDSNISVHLCQSAFTSFTAHRFSVQIANKVLNMTPYCSGFPIDSIPPVDPLDPDLLVKYNYIIALMAASIGLKLALVLTLPLFSHFLPHIEIIPTHNTIRPQFMLSNT